MYIGATSGVGGPNVGIGLITQGRCHGFAVLQFHGFTVGDEASLWKQFNGLPAQEHDWNVSFSQADYVSTLKTLMGDKAKLKAWGTRHFTSSSAVEVPENVHKGNANDNVMDVGRHGERTLCSKRGELVTEENGVTVAMSWKRARSSDSWRAKRSAWVRSASGNEWSEETRKS
ncbi:hypothetical protein CALCODRAFT_511487 [Calocera cornea HHB12733]|uniref:Uncharacterized protein n=1 Tax=Calocera cornea HHB12733 TaxID=1353952 RepID=A0A165DQY8_9BASI|nr:hypothetical protein CALCODRAFT_511487 [Calocera cornea HHB12733]